MSGNTNSVNTDGTDGSKTAEMSAEREGRAVGAGADSGVQLLQPPGWAEPSGYTNGVVASGRYVVLAGQIGWNPATSTFETDDFAAQVRQALSNIVELLTEAGAEPTHLVRLTWYITSRDEYAAARGETGRAYRETLGRHYPPMSVVEVSGLIEERAKVEIEATAVIPARQTG